MNAENAPFTLEENCSVRVVHLNRVARARQEALPDEALRRLVSIFKIMGDPTRLKIVHALSSGEMCVCDLAAYLCVSESAVSHQLRRLRDLSLVQNRREGQTLYYRLDDDHVAGLLRLAISHVLE